MADKIKIARETAGSDYHLVKVDGSDNILFDYGKLGEQERDLTNLEINDDSIPVFA